MRLPTALRASLFVLLGCLSASASAAWRPGDSPDAVLVTWRQGLGRLDLAAEAARLGIEPGAPEAKVRGALHARAGAVLKRSTPAIALDQVTLTATGGAAVDAAIAIYQASPLVDVAEPDPPLHLAAICPAPDDPLYQGGQQWYLTSTAWPQAMAAWCAGAIALSSMVTVAVIDTGADPHPDLPTLLAGTSFVSSEPTTDDFNGHGTFCAGLIGAVPGNGLGIAGAFFDPAHLRILPVKVLDQCGSGELGDLAAAMVWASQQGAQVISMSIESSSGATALQNAVQYARGQGVVMVAATGNSNGSTSYPAKYSGVVAVGALNHSDGKASYSNYGKVELSAPGGDNLGSCWTCMDAASAPGAGCPYEIWSLSGMQPGCSTRSPPEPPCAFANRYQAGAGTSFSTPLVAAAAALLLSQDSARSAEDVTLRLEQGATQLGGGFSQQTGWGKLSYYGALTYQGSTVTAIAFQAWNWPNPFSPAREGYTNLTLILPAPSNVTVRLFDASGDLVKSWELGAAQTLAGMNQVPWDGRNGRGTLVANGSYLMVVEIGASRVTKRVVVLN